MNLRVQTDRERISEAIDELRAIHYRKAPFSSRSWGHPYHSFISYPSKLKPAIAHFLVKLFSQPGDTIVDPFSGVGTIAYEACAQGRKGIGSDLSPIAYHATLAKVNPPPIETVKTQLNTLALRVEKEVSQTDLGNAEPEIHEFFHERTLREILVARSFFIEHQEMSFLMTCMLHILHGNRPYALSRRSHNIMPWPPKGEFVYKPLLRSLTEKALRMASFSLPIGFVRGMSHYADASRLPFESQTADVILTSPPFHANRDFLRMNRIRLWFCGWDYSVQEKMKASFLEHRKDLQTYLQILREFSRVLRPGGVCVMHLGVVKSFDMAESMKPYAERVGFDILGVVREDTSDLESHGIVDRGATHTHQFLILLNAG